MSRPIPVVDGDEGADIYGYAETPDEALAIAHHCFADEIVRVERYGPIALSTGAMIGEAYVVFTIANGGDNVRS